MHRLVLPLPKDFQSEAVLGDRGEYSVFDVAPQPSGAEPFLLPEAVRAYVAELTQFLQRHRLVQYHPENFFSYQLRSERENSSASRTPESEPLHLDGTPILDEEVLSLRRLCSQFEPLLSCGAGTKDALVDTSTLMSELVKCGPAAALAARRCSPSSPALGEDDGLEALQGFYAMTQRLMLHRQRRANSDYASLLFQRQPAPPTTVDSSSSAASEEVYRLLVDHNMGAKKSHEVHVMRTVIRSAFHHSLPPSAEQTSSVINVGEGKGYCSRVLALCDGIQVVGLDCNSQHKEGAAGRVEKALEGRLGAPGNTAGLPSANLLYHTRGHLASVTCRVDHPMHWEHVLSGHIPIVHDDDGCRSDAVSAVVSGEPTPLQRHALHEKATCRCCGHVMRVHHGAAIVNHVRDHVKTAEQRGVELVDRHTAQPLAMQPSLFRAATASMSQDACTEFVLREFFCHRVREDETIVPGAPSQSKRHRTEQQNSATESRSDSGSGIDERLCRGVRVDVRCLIQLDIPPAKLSSAVPQPPERRADGDVSLVSEERQPEGNAEGRASKPPLVRVLRHRLVTVTATILGRDEGSQRYKLLLDAMSDVLGELAHDPVEVHGLPSVLNVDNLTKPFMCHVRARSLNDGAATATPSTAEDSKLLSLLEQPILPDSLRLPKSTGVVPEVYILRIHPVAETRIVPIRVPSLVNTLLMGLHPCGDLGSNICRLFASSHSAGLVLVSCCWHALTRNGFPLSRAISSLGVRTESISLMLATQPFDMWGSVSADGHRGSARLLFFRSLLDLLWRQLAASFPESPLTPSSCDEEEQPRGIGRCCALPSPPHLEPSFLRQMAKVKATISFPEFVDAAFRQYFGTHEQCLRTMSHYAPRSPQQQQQTLGGDSASMADDSEVERRHFSGRASSHYNTTGTFCVACYQRMRSLFLDPVTITGDRSANPSWSPVGQLARKLEEVQMSNSFPSFLGLTVLRMWMSHLVEALLLVDRALYLHEMLVGTANCSSSDVALVPLFDGALSPRMFGILARRAGLMGKVPS